MICDMCGEELNDVESHKEWIGICFNCAKKYGIGRHTDLKTNEQHITFEGKEYTPEQWQRVLKLKAFL